jgi:hypothetical protein
MRTLITLVSFGVLLAQAQTRPEALVKHTFESETDGWISMGSNGSVKVTHEAGAVKSGSGALEYTYSLDGKGFNTVVLPLGGGKVAAMRRIRFWLKSDHDGAFGVILSEKKPGGGDYTAIIWAPKNTWQHVDLNLGSFFATDGPTDPVDPDGKLDPEQVEAIGIIDLATLFNHLPAESPMVVTKTTGSHTILLDDFEILPTDSPDASKSVSGAIIVDQFDRGFTQWITLGGMSLGLVPTGDNNPIAGPSIIATIQPADGKLAILTRRVNGADIAGTKRIAFDIAAQHEGAFAISIETKKTGAATGQGPRYNFTINPPDGRKVFRVNVSLADFDHDENSAQDPAGKLEAAHIKSIAIVDVTAMVTGASAGNTIWIGRVEMIP